MDDAETPDARVLWAGEDPPDVAADRSIELVRESDAAAAAKRAGTEAFDAVIVDGADAGFVTEVLEAAAHNAKVERRIATSTYAALPELVRCVEPRLIQRVLAKPVSAEQLIHAVVDADPSASVIYRRALNDPSDLSSTEVDQRLRDLIDRIVELPTVVIRPMSAKDLTPRLQLVVPITDPLQELRRDLPRVLGWPLKASGSAMGKAYREHPVRRVLGSLSDPQEVYCLGRDNPAYVALFPWQDNLKVTVVIGTVRPERGRIAILHTNAVSRAREFPLPTRHRKSPLMFYDPDYDWVITKNYVGPDRRRKGTKFLSRYTFRGRRKTIIPNEFSTVGTFVDVAPRWTWIAAAVFAALFLVDTAMTAYYVGGGQIGELNPVMRWALDRSPVLFWGIKTALAVAIAFVVMRWHVWKPGRWLFGACIAVYGVLDLYWLFLYVTRGL